jgi:hypothetical protein
MTEQTAASIASHNLLILKVSRPHGLLDWIAAGQRNCKTAKSREAQ